MTDLQTLADEKNISAAVKEQQAADLTVSASIDAKEASRAVAVSQKLEALLS